MENKTEGRFEITRIRQEKRPNGLVVVDAREIEDGTEITIQLNGKDFTDTEKVKEALVDEYKRVTNIKVLRNIKVGDIL